MMDIAGQEKLDWIAKRMILVILSSAAVMILGGFLFFYFNGAAEYFTGIRAADQTPITRQVTGFNFALGVLLSTALNTWKVFMINKASRRVVSDAGDADVIATEDGDIKAAPKAGKDAANYVRMQHVIRFGATVAVLLAAALVSFIDIIGAVIGIFSWQIAVYSMKFSKKFRQGSL